VVAGGEQQGSLGLLDLDGQERLGRDDEVRVPFTQAGEPFVYFLQPALPRFRLLAHAPQGDTRVALSARYFQGCESLAHEELPDLVRLGGIHEEREDILCPKGFVALGDSIEPIQITAEPAYEDGQVLVPRVVGQIQAQGGERFEGRDDGALFPEELLDALPRLLLFPDVDLESQNSLLRVRPCLGAWKHRTRLHLQNGGNGSKLDEGLGHLSGLWEGLPQAEALLLPRVAYDVEGLQVVKNLDGGGKQVPGPRDEGPDHLLSPEHERTPQTSAAVAGRRLGRGHVRPPSPHLLPVALQQGSPPSVPRSFAAPP
jgi:hypothetical protein